MTELSYMEIDHADLSNGYELYIKGAEFPMKGKPLKQEEMANFNLLKRIVISGLKLFITLPQAIFSPLKYLESVIECFNDIAERLIGPLMMETRFMSPFSRELELFLTIVLMELGVQDGIKAGTKPLAFPFARYVAQIFERDEAYRWRAQDLFTESSPENLFTQRHLKTLSQLAIDRNDVGHKNYVVKANGIIKTGPRVGKQSRQFINLLRLAILIPQVKKALTKAIKMINYTNLTFVEGDLYWAYFKLDYNFSGRTPDERMEYIKSRGWKMPFVGHEEKTL